MVGDEDAPLIGTFRTGPIGIHIENEVNMLNKLLVDL